MYIYGLPKNEIKKTRKDLIDLHKKVLTNYLLQHGVRLKVRNKFFTIYDFYINLDNIQRFFFLPPFRFVIMLLLEDPQIFIFNKKRKRRKTR